MNAIIYIADRIDPLIRVGSASMGSSNELSEMRNQEDTPRDVWLRWLNNGGAQP